MFHKTLMSIGRFAGAIPKRQRRNRITATHELYIDGVNVTSTGDVSRSAQIRERLIDDLNNAVDEGDIENFVR
jgi:nitric oxide synthase oxygenase domain/subunit